MLDFCRIKHSLRLFIYYLSLGCHSSSSLNTMRHTFKCHFRVKLGMVAHAFNGTESGRCLSKRPAWSVHQIAGLHSETLPQKQKQVSCHNTEGFVLLYLFNLLCMSILLVFMYVSGT